MASVVMHPTCGIRCTAYIKQIACQGVNQTIDCEHRSPVVSIRVHWRMSRHKTTNSGSRSKHALRDYQVHAMAIHMPNPRADYTDQRCIVPSESNVPVQSKPDS